MKTNYDKYIEEALRNNPKLRVKVWLAGIEITILQRIYDFSPKLYTKITGDKL